MGQLDRELRVGARPRELELGTVVLTFLHQGLGLFDLLASELQVESRLRIRWRADLLCRTDGPLGRAELFGGCWCAGTADDGCQSNRWNRPFQCVFHS